MQGSSATSSGTAAVLGAPLASSSTVRRGVPNLLGDGGELGGDQLAQHLLGLQDLGELGDLGGELLLLALEFELVVLGQAAQRGVEDVLGLDLRQVEDRHQPLPGGRGVVAAPDHGDDFVDVQQRDDQAVDQVQPVAALGPPELGAPPDNVDPVVDVDPQQVAQAQHPRLAVDQGDVVDPERVFHRGQAVQLLEDGLGNEAAADLDHQPQPVPAVGQVGQVGDTLQLLGLDQVLDPGDDLLRADAVGELGDDDAAAPGRRAARSCAVARVLNVPRPVS